MSENKGLQALEQRVQQRDLCTVCGACASLCPYLKSWQGRIVKLDDCDLTEGRCFSYCPRIEVDVDALHQAVFGQSYREPEMGLVRRVLMARASDPEIRKGAQTGGVVTALVDFALQAGIIDRVVVTRRDDRHLPEGCVADTREEVLACSGSSYVAGPTLEALNRIPVDDSRRIGVVGIPCQVLALGKMRASPLEKRTPIDRIGLVIGLFCTWALTYRPFLAFIENRVNGAEILKLDITPPPERLLKVTTADGAVDVPLDEIRPFIRATCSVCPDMTSEFSDLSVGTVEGMEGWNTVVIRTDRGEDLLKRATEESIVETSDLPEENLRHLKEASLLKKRRALEALKERGELETGYLKLPQGLVADIFSVPLEVGS